MKHEEIFEMYKKLFPFYSSPYRTWEPFGENKIKVTIDHDVVFVFEYRNNKQWRFSTLGIELDDRLNKAVVEDIENTLRGQHRNVTININSSVPEEILECLKDLG